MKSTSKKLILFDIDGTILLTDPHVVDMWKEIVEDCIAKEFLVSKPQIVLRELDGLLDHKILEKAATIAGVAKDVYHNKRATLYDRYQNAHEKLLMGHSQNLRPIAGAVSFLDVLSSFENSSSACLGIVTGNNARNGWMKLKVSGLKKYFSFGSFSDVATDRPALVGLARESASSHFSYQFDTTEVIVIGDTRHDIDAAKAHGFRAIAVASGFSHSLKELGDIGADLVVSSLDDPRVLECIQQ